MTARLKFAEMVKLYRQKANLSQLDLSYELGFRACFKRL